MSPMTALVFWKDKEPTPVGDVAKEGILSLFDRYRLVYSAFSGKELIEDYVFVKDLNVKAKVTELFEEQKDDPKIVEFIEVVSAPKGPSLAAACFALRLTFF
jgi:hypothetical protein